MAGLLIEEGPDNAANTAHIHNTGNAQIQVAGFLRQGLAGGAVEQRNALHDRSGEKGNKIKHLLFLLPIVFQEIQLVADEEFAANDEEQDNACEDIAKGVVQGVDGGNLTGPPVQEDQQEAGEDHGEGVKLGKPGHHNGGEAPVVGNGGGNGVVRAADQQKPRQTADRAGEHHGPHYDLAHLDAHIAGGALAFANHSDLIALLGAGQIEIHDNGQHQRHQDIQQVFIAADLGQPARHGGLVDNADLSGALGHLPEDDKVGNQLGSYIVHHQSEQCLIGVPLGLADSGNAAPDGAGQHGGEDHNDNQQPVGDLVSQQNHAGCGGQAANEDLALAAHVPEAHLERRGHCQGYHQQNGNVLAQDPHFPFRTEGTGEHGLVHTDGILPCQRRGHNGANHQGKQDRAAPDGPGPVPGQPIPFGNMQYSVLIHCSCLPAASSSCPLPVSGKHRAFLRSR